MRKGTHITDEETDALPGALESSSRSAARADTAKILFFPVRSAAAYADLEDATELDDSWESVGSVAVRLVGDFDLPRILVMGAPGDLREEVSDPREL